MSGSSTFLLYKLPDDIKEEIELLQEKDYKDDSSHSVFNNENQPSLIHKENSLLYFACSICSKDFSSLEEQKEHYQSQEHLINVKKRNEEDADLKESDDEDDLEMVEDGCWISLSLSNKRITISKRLIESGFGNRTIKTSQLSSHLDGHFTVILYRSGFFICGIYKNGTLIKYSQEKRYTTRRKQGGAQHKKDNSSGKAISMGARLRRHNELLMQEFVRTTLKQLHQEISECSIVFLGTTKLNIPLFFEEGGLDRNDPRVRKIPFYFGKPNLTEMNRVYNELCKTIISDLPEPSQKESAPLLSISSVHDTPVQEEISVLNDAVQSYTDDCYDLFWNSVKSSDLDTVQSILLERPQYVSLWNEDGETALHIACTENNYPLIQLLLECGCSPLARDIYDRLPYHCCTTKPTREFIRDYRGSHPDQYDWEKSAVPEPLTEEQKQKQKEKQKEKRRKQKEKKKEKKEEANAVTEIEEVKEEKEPEPVNHKEINQKFSPKPLSMMEQMKLTNKLHRLAQRLQIDYHTLIQYLSQDSASIAEKAQSIEELLDSGEVPAEVIIESMLCF